MDEKQGYIVYKGKVFQIEWFYSRTGKSQAYEYYKKLTASDRIRILRLFQIMGEVGKIHNLKQFRNEGNKIYSFKPHPHRFLCFFFTDSKIIVTNAFVKKQARLPKAEKEKALKCKEDYENRNKEESYYEEDHGKNDNI